MKKSFLFLAATAVMLSACSISQPNDESSSIISSSSASSFREESSQSSQSSASSQSSSSSSESSSLEVSVSSEPIEKSSSEELIWASMDEAINFYENTLRVDIGEEQARVDMESKFHERDAWELIDNEGDTIVLFKPNLGRKGGQAVEFIKKKEKTDITFFNNDTLPTLSNPVQPKSFAMKIMFS